MYVRCVYIYIFTYLVFVIIFLYAFVITRGGTSIRPDSSMLSEAARLMFAEGFRPPRDPGWCAQMHAIYPAIYMYVLCIHLYLLTD